MKSVEYDGGLDLPSLVKKSGYFMIPGFFNPKIVKRTKHELSQILDDDLNKRQNLEIKSVNWLNDGHRSTLNPLMHTFLYPSIRSPLFCNLVNEMFADPHISDFMRFLTGRAGYRLRVDLVRRSSGKNDWVDSFQLPHPWHKDSPGEFTFGIFFDNLDKKDSGATSVITGTHWEKLYPHWDLVLSEKKTYTSKIRYKSNAFPILPESSAKRAFINKALKRKLKLSERAIELNGSIGDLYFFLNDTWHGRAANITGQKLMMARIGGFSNDFEFKDDLPSQKNIGRLPGKLGKHYKQVSPAKANTGPSFLKTLRENQSSSFLGHLAMLEKKLLVFAAQTSKKKE